MMPVPGDLQAQPFKNPVGCSNHLTTTNQDTHEWDDARRWTLKGPLVSVLEIRQAEDNNTAAVLRAVCID